MVAVLFRALDAFRIFDNVFIMTNGANGTEVLSLLAYRTSIGRLEIGLGSAISVLLFLCVILICFIAIKLFKVDLAEREGSELMGAHVDAGSRSAGPSSRSSCSSYALFPVRLDLRDVVQAAEPAATSGMFLPKTWTTENYEQILRRASAQDLFLPSLRNSIGICLIATAIAVVLATLAAYAIARLDFPGKRLVLTTALGGRRSSRSSRSSRRCSTCGATSASTTPGSA